ncbi:LCP family protein [Antrihabitans sp. YC3-6]|uniref:LCP family protein n=1 Tax=Antrihabitans stalagmiti TaxID=2799499 RepID=A0A934NR29_9NOCA|nr:LCP family protein [Antrihabitans stalagmiti]MBJ8339861.1 LCP family protein [Antrihabitans stalagmiti]
MNGDFFSDEPGRQPPPRRSPPPRQGPPPRQPPPPRRPEPEETEFVRRPSVRPPTPQAWSQAPQQPNYRPPQQPPPRQAQPPRPPAGPPPGYRPPERNDGVRYAPTQQPERFTERPPRYAASPPPPPPSRRSTGPTGPPPRPPRARTRRSPWRWVRRILLLPLILLLVLIGIAVYIVTLPLEKVDALVDYPGRVADTPGTNWLLVGSDSRTGLTPEEEQALATGGDTGPERTDTIILIHLPKSGPAVMVSIPRDSYLAIPDNGTDKVNASFAIGGPALLVQTIEGATGVHIDHYAQIGFDGFAGLVDSLGGVDMCLDQPIDDPLAGINLPGGCQKLNGAEALGVVRSRATPLADLDRINRQRQFMSALLKKSTSPTTVLNPFKLLPFAKGAVESLKVDRGDGMTDLARLGWALRGEMITTTVPISGFEDVDGSGNVLLWDDARAAQFFGALANDEPIPPELITTGP